MQKKLKKMLSVLPALVMVLSLMVLTAMAGVALCTKKQKT